MVFSLASSPLKKTTTGLYTLFSYTVFPPTGGGPAAHHRLGAILGCWDIIGELSSVYMSHTVVLSIYAVDAGKEELGEPGDQGTGSSFLILGDDTLVGADLVVIDDDHKSFFHE